MTKKTTDSNAEEITSMHQLPGIRQLKHDKVNLHEQRPKKGLQKPRHARLEHQILAFESSEFAPHISAPDSWFNAGLQKKQQRRIRMGQIPFDDIIDLHGLYKHEALRELEQVIEDMRLKQSRMLLVIHGKGYRSEQQAVLRPLVLRWLREQTQVLAWCPAQPHHGGDGATYVYLKQTGQD